MSKHYKMEIEPIEYINRNGLSFMEGNVVKYVSRHAKKGGADDIKKAIHYLQLILENEYNESHVLPESVRQGHPLTTWIFTWPLGESERASRKPRLTLFVMATRTQRRNSRLSALAGNSLDRSDEGLFDHMDSIVLDFDHIDVEKSVLATDAHVYSCWVSLSGDGLKALVRVTNLERHRDHFRALKNYFNKQYDLEVDESGINESRACFESYDPDLIVNESWGNLRAFA